MGSDKETEKAGRQARGAAQRERSQTWSCQCQCDTNAFQRGPQLTGKENEHVVQPGGRGRRLFQDSAGSGRPGESERDWLVLTEQKAGPGSWPLLWLRCDPRTGGGSRLCGEEDETHRKSAVCESSENNRTHVRSLSSLLAPSSTQTT